MFLKVKFRLQHKTQHIRHYTVNLDVSLYTANVYECIVIIFGVLDCACAH